jgi:CheY-like chemotaxis protein
MLTSAAATPLEPRFCFTYGFFTSRPDGKGTGLGLSTVYGIVPQSGGHIRVESALATARASNCSFQRPILRRNPATILVADDEPALRQAVVQILRANGYSVLEPQTSNHALEIAEQTRGRLDVLLADIVMPGMRGTELASRVAAAHPEVQVIHMSGYAAEIQESGPLENSVFLQKPFRFATLLEQLKFLRRRH